MSADRSLVKTAHKRQSFTESEIEEFKRCMENPHYFLDNYFYIQHPTKGKMLYTAFDYQKRLIDSYHNHRFAINLLPRQAGKCVRGDTTMIRLRNKHTGDHVELSIGDFFEMQKKSHNK
jgi:hypothetical protein